MAYFQLHVTIMQNKYIVKLFVHQNNTAQYMNSEFGANPFSYSIIIPVLFDVSNSTLLAVITS